MSHEIPLTNAVRFEEALILHPTYSNGSVSKRVSKNCKPRINHFCSLGHPAIRPGVLQFRDGRDGVSEGAVRRIGDALVYLV